MNAALVEITGRLEQAEATSDDALELILAGRPLLAGARAGLRARFERAESQVLGCWAATVANAALRGTPNVTADTAEEARAEARLWVLEQLVEYRPADDGNPGAFLRTRQNWFRSELRRTASPGLSTKANYKVAGAASDQRRRLTQQLGREPTREELQAAAADQLAEQARARLVETNPKLKGRALDEAVTRRLDKDGITRALGEFTQVQIAALGKVYLDAQPEPELLGGFTPGADERVVDSEDAFDRLMRVALGDAQWARPALSAKGGAWSARVETEPESPTYQALSELTDHSAQDIKAVLRTARARISAPHAQWAHCADGVLISG